MDFMQQLRAHAMANVRLGYLRFFTPTQQFWEAMEQWRGQGFIECGAGSGETTREAVANGFKFMAVDICKRDGQDNVTIIDATMMSFSDAAWPIICRPDHSGWCEDVMDRALEAGAGCIYVGLRRNVENDLGDHFGEHDAFFADVGEEDECLWYFAPRSRAVTF